MVTVGTAEKAARARELGCDARVLYKEQDFVDAGPFDVILDNMGAAYLSRNVDALATGGRLVVIGMQGGVKGELNLATLLGKRGAVHATTLRARPAQREGRDRGRGAGRRLAGGRRRRGAAGDRPGAALDRRSPRRTS